MLRDYQEQALDEIRAHFRAGTRRVLLQMATGGGKTATFCELLKKAYEKGTPSLVAVRGRKLIDQASQRLMREGVPHGIIMSGRDMDHHELIRICSIDTLYRRRQAPEASLIVIDEAHQTGGAGYSWFLEQYPKAFLLPVSATPHLKRGMRHVADVVVRPVTAKELTERGFLVPLRYFAPEEPDLTGVSTSGDDYNQKELGEAMEKAALSGSIVDYYRETTPGKRAILFAVNVAHSEELVAQFEKAGIPAGHVDATSSDGTRLAAIAALERGDIKILSNVGILTTGVDIPAVEAIIMARPTKSYNLWIQMIGRGTRPAPGKADCIVLDHAGNVHSHGFLEHEALCNLDGSSKNRPAPMIDCEDCRAIFAAPAPRAECHRRFCPACGWWFPPEPGIIRRTDIDEEEGLVELRAEPWLDRLHTLAEEARRKNFKKGWVFHKLKGEHPAVDERAVWKVLKKMPEWFNEAKRTQSSSMRSFFDSVPDPT